MLNDLIVETGINHRKCSTSDVILTFVITSRLNLRISLTAEALLHLRQKACKLLANFIYKITHDVSSMFSVYRILNIISQCHLLSKSRRCFSFAHLHEGV